MKIFIIYDGINNSVFQSQVLAPFKKEAEKSNEKFLIVTFEKFHGDLPFKWFDTIFNFVKNHSPRTAVHPEYPTVKEDVSKDDRDQKIKIIQFKRLPFLGKFSLF